MSKLKAKDKPTDEDSDKLEKLQIKQFHDQDDLRKLVEEAEVRMCACACVCARVRACVRACVRVYLCA